MSEEDFQMERRRGYEMMQRQMVGFRRDLEANTRLTQETRFAVAALQLKSDKVINAFEAAEGAFKALEFIGKLLKPFVWFSLAGGFIALAYKAVVAYLRTI